MNARRGQFERVRARLARDSDTYRARSRVRVVRTARDIGVATLVTVTLGAATATAATTTGKTTTAKTSATVPSVSVAAKPGARSRPSVAPTTTRLIAVIPTTLPAKPTGTIEEAQRLVAEARAAKNRKALVLTLNELALRLLAAKRAPEAVTALRESISSLGSLNDPVVLRNTKVMLGWALNAAGDFAAATPVLLETLTAADQQHADQRIFVNILQLLAWGTRASGDHAHAMQVLGRLRDLGVKGDSSIDLADVYEGLALEQIATGAMNDAVASARLAVTRRAAASPVLQAGSYQVLGYALDVSGAHAEAMVALQQSIDLRKGAGLGAADPAEAFALLAEAARKAGDVGTNLAARTELIAVARASGDPGRLADSLDDFALAALTAGRAPDALRPLRESVTLRSAKPDSPALGGSLQMLGWALSETKALDEAVDAYRRAVKVRTAVNDTRDAQLESLRSLGFLLWTLKKPDDSPALFEQVVVLVRRPPTSTPAEAGAFVDLSVAYLLSQHPDQALTSANRAVSLYDGVATKGEPMAAALYTQGWALFNSGRQRDAIEAFRRSLVIRLATGSDKITETRNFLNAAIEASRSADAS